MSIKARRGLLLVALMVVVSALVFLVGPLTNKAQAQTEPPPRLFGEELVAFEDELSGQAVGTININRTCDATGGTGTFHFTASGDASGPYPGTFTETGTVEVGPYDFFNAGNTIRSLTTNFEIDSPVGHITGTKTFVPGSSTGTGSCHFMSTVVSTENVQVEATIKTPDGLTCTTTGTADLNVSENVLLFGVIKHFREKFDVGFDTPTCGGSEEPRPQISIANTTVNEGDTGTSDATFNVTLSEASTNAVTVDYATADGTATQPEDYQQTQGTLTFEANQTTATVTVPVSGDTADEPDESFSVLLSNPQNAGIADGEGSATIVDDDDVTIGDTTPPVLSLPNDMTVEATDSSGAKVTYDPLPTATDEDPANPDVSCTPSSGESFPLGQTTVICSATDAAGNKAEGTFNVTVEDSSPPTISEVPTDINETASSSAGAVVTYNNPTASDLVDGNNVAVNCEPPSGSTFPLGSTQVTCSATDKAGNKAEESFKVSVTYAWSGTSQPINGGSTPEYSDDTSVFKLGSTVPVKFILTDASAGISGAEAKLYAAKVTNEVVGTEVETISTATASSGNLFRNDATSEQYVFNWSTKGLTAGTYQLRIDLADGVSRTVRVSLK